MTASTARSSSATCLSATFRKCTAIENVFRSIAAPSTALAALACPAPGASFGVRILAPCDELFERLEELSEPDDGVGDELDLPVELPKLDFLKAEVGGAAKLTGRPVKWIEDRSEHMMAGGHACEQEFDVEAAVSGNLVASITVQQLATTGNARPDELGPRLALWHKQTGERQA